MYNEAGIANSKLRKMQQPGCVLRRWLNVCHAYYFFADIDVLLAAVLTFDASTRLYEGVSDHNMTDYLAEICTRPPVLLTLTC